MSWKYYLEKYKNLVINNKHPVLDEILFLITGLGSNKRFFVTKDPMEI